MPNKVANPEYNDNNGMNNDNDSIRGGKYHPRSIGIKELKVEHFMTKNPVMARSNVNLPGGVDIMTTNNISNLVVIENRNPIGVLTEREVLYYLTNYRTIPTDKLLKDIILQPFCVVDLKAPLLEAATKMIRKKCRILVSRTGGGNKVKSGSALNQDRNEEIVGIITASDMVKAFAEQTDKDPTMRSVMSKRIYSINLNDPIYDAIKIMYIANVGSVIVVHEEKNGNSSNKRRLYGIFTERDLLTRVLSNDVSIDEHVEEYCSTELLTANIELGATEAAKIMRIRNIKRLPLTTEVSAARPLGADGASTLDETIWVDDKYNLEAIVTARDLVDLFQSNN